MSLRLVLIRFIYWLRSLREDPEYLFKTLGVTINDHIMEVGCAAGYHTSALCAIASKGKVYAVDIWEEGLAHMERTLTCHTVELVHCSAHTVELPSSSLDKIICFDTLHEVPAPVDTVKRWSLFLKKGGTLLYKDPELSSEHVAQFSEGTLNFTEEIEGVSVLVRQ